MSDTKVVPLVVGGVTVSLSAKDEEMPVIENRSGKEESDQEQIDLLCVSHLPTTRFEVIIENTTDSPRTVQLLLDGLPPTTVSPTHPGMKWTVLEPQEAAETGFTISAPRVVPIRILVSAAAQKYNDVAETNIGDKTVQVDLNPSTRRVPAQDAVLDDEERANRAARQQLESTLRGMALNNGDTAGKPLPPNVLRRSNVIPVSSGTKVAHGFSPRG